MASEVMQILTGAGLAGATGHRAFVPPLLIGLAHHMVLRNDVPAGQPVRWADVAFDAGKEAVRVRLEMEALFRRELGLAPGKAA